VLAPSDPSASPALQAGRRLAVSDRRGSLGLGKGRAPGGFPGAGPFCGGLRLVNGPAREPPPPGPDGGRRPRGPSRRPPLPPSLLILEPQRPHAPAEVVAI